MTLKVTIYTDVMMTISITVMPATEGTPVKGTNQPPPVAYIPLSRTRTYPIAIPTSQK